MLHRLGSEKGKERNNNLIIMQSASLIGFRDQIVTSCEHRIRKVDT